MGTTTILGYRATLQLSTDYGVIDISDSIEVGAPVLTLNMSTILRAVDEVERRGYVADESPSVARTFSVALSCSNCQRGDNYTLAYGTRVASALGKITCSNCGVAGMLTR